MAKIEVPIVLSGIDTVKRIVKDYLAVEIHGNEDVKAGFNLFGQSLLGFLSTVKSDWISVKDAMPPENGDYLVAYHPCYWDSVDWNTVAVGIDSFRGKTTWAKNKYRRVTHWMPLPAPPEEGAADD